MDYNYFRICRAARRLDFMFDLIVICLPALIKEKVNGAICVMKGAGYYFNMAQLFVGSLNGGAEPRTKREWEGGHLTTPLMAVL